MDERVLKLLEEFEQRAADLGVSYVMVCRHDNVDGENVDQRIMWSIDNDGDLESLLFHIDEQKERFHFDII